MQTTNLNNRKIRHHLQLTMKSSTSAPNINLNRSSSNNTFKQDIALLVRVRMVISRTCRIPNKDQCLTHLNNKPFSNNLIKLTLFNRFLNPSQFSRTSSQLEHEQPLQKLPIQAQPETVQAQTQPQTQILILQSSSVLRSVSPHPQPQLQPQSQAQPQPHPQQKQQQQHAMPP